MSKKYWKTKEKKFKQFLHEQFERSSQYLKDNKKSMRVLIFSKEDLIELKEILFGRKKEVNISEKEKKEIDITYIDSAISKSYTSSIEYITKEKIKENIKFYERLLQEGGWDNLTELALKNRVVALEELLEENNYE